MYPMYPLSSDAAAKLSFLVGKEICQVCVGSYDVQFHWGDGGISIWSKFVYRPAGADEVTWGEGNPELAARTVSLLKASITEIKCSQRTLTLVFCNRDELKIFEDERYESFSIRDGKNPEIIV